MQAMRIKARGSHLLCKVPNKCPNVSEPVEVVKKNKS